MLSKLNRRAVLTGAATASIVTLPVAAKAATGNRLPLADPIFAAIRSLKEAAAANDAAWRKVAHADDQFKAEYGTLMPSGLSKEAREAMSAIFPAFARAAWSTHKQIDQIRERWLDMPDAPEAIERMHAELDRQTKRHRQLFGDLKEEANQADELYLQAAEKLISTVPTSIGGLLALCAYVRSDERLLWEELHIEDRLDILLGTVTKAIEHQALLVSA
jgi:hypothetical protein